MFEKLKAIEEEYQKLSRLISNAEVMKDREKYLDYTKTYASLGKIVSRFGEYKTILKEMEECKDILQEEGENGDLITLARKELAGLEEKKARLRRS